MNLQTLQHLFPILIFAAFASRTLSKEDPQYTACAPSNCGYGDDIKYPFWIAGEQQPYCGHPSFEITCIYEYPVFNFSDVDYFIRDIFYANNSFLLVNPLVYEEELCPAPQRNLSLDGTPFNLSPKNSDFIFFYNCTSQPMPLAHPVDCAAGNASVHSFAYFLEDALPDANNYAGSCDSVVTVPIDVSVDLTNLQGMYYSLILNMGFLLNWTENNCSKCEISGGRCGFESDNFVCFCPNGPSSQTCNDESKWRKKLIIGIASVGGFVMAVVLWLIYWRYRRKKYIRKSTISRSLSLSSRTDSEEGSAYYGLPIFNYNELKRATNNFDPAGELGDGGFGTVFKGKLRDGREVAVKRLYEHNYKRVEQFMNEVEILTRLRHPNLVSLYGCTSRQSHRLLLVYEYVPNGTVADHLHGEKAKPGLPVWPTRLNIAVETAKALLYLHKSDVVHRDVKTNNILLDENFGVKVADFGLSRLFPLNVTHVSTAPQGTPGYVDPEYRKCYQLTEKSDVYSFGVILMELISSLPAVDITRHRHEINLSAMAMNKIQSQALHELVDPHLGFDSDYKTRNMIAAVAELAFQCLQQAHDMRPSMEKVLEILNDVQNGGCCTEKIEEADVPSDDAVPLTKNQLTLSPKSVTTPWSSDISTPNTSG